MWDVSDDAVNPDAAIDWFKNRTTMFKGDWADLDEQARRRAFTLADVYKMDQIEHVRDSITRALEQGIPFEQWQKQIERDLPGLFAGKLDNPAARLETVFRNATQTAYNAGRYEAMTDPDVIDARPYWFYDAILDRRTTDICKTYDSVLLAASHPWWQTHYPPCHHRCRSGVRSMTEEQARQRGVTASPPYSPPPAPGFGRGPSLGEWEPSEQEHDPDLMEIHRQKAAQEAQEAQEAFDREHKGYVDDLERRAAEHARVVAQVDARRPASNSNAFASWDDYQDWAYHKQKGELAERRLTLLRQDAKLGVQAERELARREAAYQAQLKEAQKTRAAFDAETAPLQARLAHVRSEIAATTKEMDRLADDINDALARGDDALAVKLDDRYNEIWDRRKKMWDEETKIQQQVDRAVEKVGARYVDTPGELRVANVGAPAGYDYDAHVREFNRMVNSREMAAREVAVKTTPSGRAFYHPKDHSINMAATSPVRTTIHELGHAWEDSDPFVREKSLDFLYTRTKGEQPQKMSVLTGNPAYADNELARPDGFFNPYIGKIYYGASETVSMGVEYMYVEPLTLLKDPGHYDLIYALQRSTNAVR